MGCDSILNDTKKALGLPSTDTSFDPELIMFINGVFSDLLQLGVGPEEGYEIEDKSDTWDDFIDGASAKSYNNVRTYIYLKVRLLFDPPTTSFLVDAIQKQIEEKETRIRYNREWLLDPVDPMAIT